jgi:hypothetical protein
MIFKEAICLNKRNNNKHIKKHSYVTINGKPRIIRGFEYGVRKRDK